MLSESKDKEVLENTNYKTMSDAENFLSTYGVSKNSVEIWGSGHPKREFLWSEDMADACVFLMENRNFEDTFAQGQNEIRNTHINIGTRKDISIRELAETIKKNYWF